ncbi:MAG: glycosyltransferase [Dehalococcoidia bacterium]
MSIVHYGVDPEAFDQPEERNGVRLELGVPLSAPLMLHVGRFIEAKNHCALIDIFRLVRRRRPDVHLLLVGQGEFQVQTRAQVASSRLEDCVHFLGRRSDVPRLMRSSDLLVMPSVREGLPVTLIEAAAAGLRAVASDLPGMQEANEVVCKARLLSVSRPIEEWAEAVIESLEAPRLNASAELELIRKSGMSIGASARKLEQIYRECGHSAMPLEVG